MTPFRTKLDSLDQNWDQPFTGKYDSDVLEIFEGLFKRIPHNQWCKLPYNGIQVDETIEGVNFVHDVFGLERNYFLAIMHKVGFLRVNRNITNSNISSNSFSSLRFSYPNSKSAWNAKFWEYFINGKLEIDICTYYRHPYVIVMDLDLKIITY